MSEPIILILAWLSRVFYTSGAFFEDLYYNRLVSRLKSELSFVINPGDHLKATAAFIAYNLKSNPDSLWQVGDELTVTHVYKLSEQMRLEFRVKHEASGDSRGGVRLDLYPEMREAYLKVEAGE